MQSDLLSQICAAFSGESTMTRRYWSRKVSLDHVGSRWITLDHGIQAEMAEPNQILTDLNISKPEHTASAQLINSDGSRKEFNIFNQV